MVYLCQYLDIFTVLNLEETCRFFIGITRNPLSCYRFTMDNIDNNMDNNDNDSKMNLSFSPINLDNNNIIPWQCIPSSRYSSYSFSTTIQFKFFIEKYSNNPYYLKQLQIRFCNVKQLYLNGTYFNSTLQLKSCTKLMTLSSKCA